jgi:hypothetical protein
LMTLLGNFVQTSEQVRCGRLRERERSQWEATGLPDENKKRGGQCQ